jgi:hypothetical protein
LACRDGHTVNAHAGQVLRRGRPYVSRASDAKAVHA